ncbi:hypothetical protein HFN89_05630 [Rhizobium laguerreae]|nr:hypothetical protein [Rhizobium laguerreae]
MTSNDKKTAETKLRKLMKSKEPMTKERALESLALLMAAGRVRIPSSGSGTPIEGEAREGQIKPF